MSRDKDITYSEIEELTSQVKDFIEDKGFEVLNSFEFLTRLEKVLYEEIKKYYE